MSLSDEMKAAEAAHDDDVTRLRKQPLFRNVSSAKTWSERVLGPLWCGALHLDDDIGICEALEMTDTMALILRLFGHAVHGKGNSKLPRISNWKPVVDGNVIRKPHALNKRNIGAIIGKSQSAVNDALGRFRGKTSKYERFFDRRLAYPVYVPTGIMLDVMFTLNLSFAFMLEDYLYAERVADSARLNDAPTNYKQKVWCREGKAEKLQTKSEPRQERINVGQEQRLSP